jgi:periplasmic glucans biosynthesis protein
VFPLGAQTVALIATLLIAGAQAAPAPTSAPSPATPPPPSAPANAAPAAVPHAAPAPHVEPFSFATVERLAQQRSQEAYRDRSSPLPPRLARLTYDQFRDIRYKGQTALWHDQSLFEVQFFHRGFTFARQVNINEVNAAGVTRPILYSPTLFTFGHLTALTVKDLPQRIGFAGFRVHYPLHTPLYKDELAVFLGASYFKVLGRRQGYGLSARGLAVNTATVGGEEFPAFTDFWLVRPEKMQRVLTIYALLDSESVTGAYRFDLHPDSMTQVDVTAEIYPRKDIEKVGIAPLTSMFLFGEDHAGRHFDDFRPEVHDSDGLMEQTGKGEWLWRPLSNPKELRVSRLIDHNPRGFGLVQRDRNFDHYQDSESRFQARPSYWIEPRGDWGDGGVELVEIPSDEETNDNIVAYWVPSAPVKAHQTLKYSYVLSAYSESALWPPAGKVIATRTGSSNIPGSSGKANNRRRFVIDFAGSSLGDLNPSQAVTAAVSVNHGQIDNVTVERILETGAWRVAFRYTPDGTRPADLHCYLTLYGESLTETWTYLWNP